MTASAPRSTRNRTAAVGAAMVIAVSGCAPTSDTGSGTPAPPSSTATAPVALPTDLCDKIDFAGTVGKEFGDASHRPHSVTTDHPRPDSVRCNALFLTQSALLTDGASISINAEVYPTPDKARQHAVNRTRDWTDPNFPCALTDSGAQAWYAVFKDGFQILTYDGTVSLEVSATAYLTTTSEQRNAATAACHLTDEVITHLGASHAWGRG